MKTIKIQVKKLGILFSLLGIFFVNLSYTNLLLSESEWKAYVLTKTNPITAYQLTYQGIINVPPAEDNFIKSEKEKHQNILEKRKSNQLTEIEENQWKLMTDVDLKKAISDLDRISKGFQITVTVIYSTKGNQKRQDYFRENTNLRHYFDIFDGKEAFHCIADDNSIKKGAYYTAKWLNPTSDNGYGINLGNYIQNGYSISKYDPDNLKIQIQSDVYMHPGEIYEFTLLDSHYEYWKECNILSNNGGSRRKVICENFMESNSIMIPQIIKEQKRGKGGVWEDSMSLTLVDAKTSNVDFPEGFFTPSKDENIKITDVGR